MSQPCDTIADVQSSADTRQIAINKVGIKDIRHPVKILDRTGVVEQRGFAYEGAAMALALLDHVLPWRRNRLARFIRGPARDHIYMAHVGAGWALARLRRGTNRYFHKLDPLLRWLAMDGYGFHEGYFHWQRTIEARQQPRQPERQRKRRRFLPFP